MTELVKLIVGYLSHQLKRQSRLVVMIRQSPLVFTDLGINPNPLMDRSSLELELEFMSFG
jgi:hypothetical protein